MYNRLGLSPGCLAVRRALVMLDERDFLIVTVGLYGLYATIGDRALRKALRKQLHRVSKKTVPTYFLLLLSQI